MAFEIVVIGTSTGGLKALQTLLSGLSPEFPVPIVIVQHRGVGAETGLCEFLNQVSSIPVSEPEDKEPLIAGRIFLAPRDYHLLISNRSFALSTDPPVGFARPSIDVLFESTADEFGDRAIGVILTGANRDGARGLAAIKSRGGLTLVEDPVRLPPGDAGRGARVNESGLGFATGGNSASPAAIDCRRNPARIPHCAKHPRGGHTIWKLKNGSYFDGR